MSPPAAASSPLAAATTLKQTARSPSAAVRLLPPTDRSRIKLGMDARPREVSIRYVVCFLLLAGITVSLSMRTHISMTIVCMLAPPNKTTEETAGMMEERIGEEAEEMNGTLFSPSSALLLPGKKEECPRHEVATDAKQPRRSSGDLHWSPSQASFLFFASFASTFVALVRFGRLADSRSPTKIFLGVVVVQLLATLLSPLLADTSYYGFIATRIIIGFAEGLQITAMSAVASRWFPPSEMSTMVAVYTSAFQISFGVTPFIVSRLCASLGDWRPIFYVLALASTLWSVAWCIFVTDEPAANRFVGERERAFLSSAISPRRRQAVAADGTKSRAIPLWSIVKTPVMMAHMMSMAGFYFMVSVTGSFLPLFLKEQIRLPLSENGLYTMAPFLVQIAAKNLLGVALDHFVRAGRLSHTHASKAAQTFGTFVSAAGLIGLAFVPDCHSPGLALAFLLVFGGSLTCCAVGFYTSMLHLCPAISGTITSLVTSAGFFSSMFAMAIMNVITYFELPHKYSIVFCVGALLQVISGIVYVIWGSAERQQWLVDPAESATPLRDLVKEAKKANDVDDSGT